MTDNVKPLLKSLTLNNEDTIQMLTEWLRQAEDGELVTVGLVGKRIGGEWQTGMSRSDNSLEDAAMLIELGMRRLGFVIRGKE